MKNIWRALQFFRPDAPRIVVVLALLLSSIALNVLKPWPLAIIIDSLLGTKPLPSWWPGAPTERAHLLGLLVGATLLIHFIQGALSAGQNYLSIRIGLRGLTRVRNQLFAWLQRLSLRFYQGSKTGDIIYRTAWDTYSFQTLFQQGLMTFVTALVSLLLMIGVMARVNGLLTLVALATVPLLFLTIKLLGGKMTSRNASAQTADSQVTSLVQQNIAALPLIQSYTREAQEQERFSAQTAEAETRRISQHAWEIFYWLIISIIFAVGATAITWLGAREVMASRLTVGQLLIFLTYLAQLYEPLNQLSHVGATVLGATAGTRRVFEIFDTPDEIKDAPGVVAPPLIRGEIHFNHVSFHYQPERQVLQDIDFQIKAGETIAIIGPSGAGKTTLINLLPRFFDPSSGALTLDGIDARQLPLAFLRSQIAVVLQEPVILPATVAENIGYGKIGATAQEIEAAARAANAHQFIEKLPRKYETVIGEGAARLSVGEKQRVNLARAFLKNAPILLLDEPTSALDSESEKLVIESVEHLMQGRTTLIIAHRLTTIRRVNRILVLKEGRIDRVATPAEFFAGENEMIIPPAG